MQYLVQSSDCPRLFFRLASVSAAETLEYLLPQLQGAKEVQGSSIDGFLLSSIEVMEDLDAILTFPSPIHKKAVFKTVTEWKQNGIPFLLLMGDKVEYATQPQSATKAHNVSFSSPVQCDFDVGVDNRAYSGSGESALTLTQSTGAKRHHAKIPLSQSLNPEEIPFQDELLTQRENKADVPLSQETHSSSASSHNEAKKKKRKSSRKEKEKRLPPKKIARKTLLARASSSSGGSSSETEDGDEKDAVVDTMQQLAKTIKIPIIHFSAHELTRLRSLVSKYTIVREDGSKNISWDGIGNELGKSPHDCYSKYQEVKARDEAAVAAMAAVTQVLPSTQSSGLSSISRATSGSSTSSDSSKSSGSGSSDSTPIAPQVNNGDSSSASVQAPPASPLPTRSAHSGHSSNSKSKKATEVGSIASKPARETTLAADSASLQSLNASFAENAGVGKTAAVRTISNGSSSKIPSKMGRKPKAEDNDKRKYSDNKTKNSVTIRAFKDCSRETFLEYASYIDNDNARGDLELRGLEFIIFLFLEENKTYPDKHLVVKQLVELGIPVKLMTYVNLPCDDCCKYQSIKIVSYILTHAAKDEKRLLTSFLDWGLLPSLYSIARYHRDVNIVQNTLWCLSLVLKIDETLRKEIMVENEMLNIILEILNEADDYKLYKVVFAFAEALFGKRKEWVSLWTEVVYFDLLFAAVGKIIRSPWSASKLKEVLMTCLPFVNGLLEADIQIASESLLQSSLCGDVISWLNSASKPTDDVLLEMLNLLGNVVEVCEPQNPDEVDRVMICDPVPVLLAHLPKSRITSEEICQSVVNTLAYITDFIPHRPSINDLLKNDVHRFIAVLSNGSSEIKQEATTCLIRILEHSTPTDQSVWSTKCLLDTLLKLLHDYCSRYENNTAMEDDERHEEEYLLRRMLRVVNKVLSMDENESLTEDKTLYIDDWIEISAWVARMYRHDREVMEALTNG